MVCREHKGDLRIVVVDLADGSEDCFGGEHRQEGTTENSVFVRDRERRPVVYVMRNTEGESVDPPLRWETAFPLGEASLFRTARPLPLPLPSAQAACPPVPISRPGEAATCRGTGTRQCTAGRRSR